MNSIILGFSPTKQFKFHNDRGFKFLPKQSRLKNSLTAVFPMADPENPNGGELILYRTQEGNVRIDVLYRSETFG
jgi:predicted 2-oxoglutarate/Fe(II)-dependent dioxygenase YbiX